MEGVVWIREQSSIVTSSPSYFRDMVKEAIRDLEAEYRSGEIEAFAYYQRTRALGRMLR